jgi:hypothetical protein
MVVLVVEYGVGMISGRMRKYSGESLAVLCYYSPTLTRTEHTDLITIVFAVP